VFLSYVYSPNQKKKEQKKGKKFGANSRRILWNKKITKRRR